VSNHFFPLFFFASLPPEGGVGQSVTLVMTRSGLSHAIHFPIPPRISFREVAGRIFSPRLSKSSPHVNRTSGSPPTPTFLARCFLYFYFFFNPLDGPFRPMKRPLRMPPLGLFNHPSVFARRFFCLNSHWERQSYVKSFPLDRELRVGSPAHLSVLFLISFGRKTSSPSCCGSLSNGRASEG